MIGGSFLRRAAIGGLAGGVMTGNLGGAAGGAAVGAGGWGMLSKMGGGTARGIQRGLGMGVRAAQAGSRWGAKGYYSSIAGPRALAGGSAFRASNAIGMGFSNASKFIGRNAATTNKIGGAAMGAIGVGSGAYIGSSVMSSNRGF